MKFYLFSSVLILSLLASLGLLGKLVCNRAQLKEANSKLNEELMQANLELGRAHTQFGDASKYAEFLEEAVQEEINNRSALVTRYGVLKAELKVQKKKQRARTMEYYEGAPIEVCSESAEFIPGFLYRAITEKSLNLLTSLSGAYEDHRLTIMCQAISIPDPTEPIPIFIGYGLRLKIRGVFVETITPSGAINHYAALYETDEKGEDVKKLKLTDFSFVVEDQRSNKWFWWAPILDIGALGGISGFGIHYTAIRANFGASLGFSWFGYGLAKDKLSWRILRLSMDVSDTLGFGLTPGMYNLGESGLIPLIKNVWIGPHISFGLDESITIGIFLGAAL